jgi:hypothetical protein
VGATERGLDPAKKVEGRKRHLLVDTEGLVLQARVHNAKVPDEDGIRLLCWARCAIALGTFRTCGPMPATKAGAEGGSRTSFRLERGGGAQASKANPRDGGRGMG